MQQRWARKQDTFVFTHPIRDDFAFNDDVSIALYRICQEALTNITRHAEATQARAMREKNRNTIKLSILDNGKGILTGKISNQQSFGLRGMRERGFPFGGLVEIAGEQNKGSSVIAVIPVEKAQANIW